MLTRRRRTTTLVQAGPAFARELADQVRGCADVVELEAPRQGLVMCQVRETARNSRFYLAEAVMCECRVRVAGTDGLGAVLGDDMAFARDLAVLDAAMADGSLPVAAELERRVLEREAELAAGREERAAEVLSSTVSFSTMGGQDMSVQAVVK